MDQEELTTLTRMATELAEAEAAVADAERVLKQRKEVVRQLATEKLPAFFTECGASRVDMLGTPFYAVLLDVATCGLPPTSEPQDRKLAIDWLCANGYEPIVKHTFTVAFNKGAHEEAAACRHMLDQAAFQYVEKDDVHYQTLSATFREALEEDKPWPVELFRVYQGQVVKIKKG